MRYPLRPSDFVTARRQVRDLGVEIQPKDGGISRYRRQARWLLDRPHSRARRQSQTRHCEQSEAVQTFDAARTGLLRGACQRAGVRPTRWLAMTGQASAISRRHAPEVCKKFSHAFKRKRAQGMPGARCTRSLACNKKKTHAHLQGSPESHRHSLRNGVNSSSVVALVYRAC